MMDKWNFEKSGFLGLKTSEIQILVFFVFKEVRKPRKSRF